MEHRRSPRIETDIPVNYDIIDETGCNISSGVGRAINMSRHGILLMTMKPLQNVHVIMLTMKIDGNDVKFKGRLVSSNIHHTPGYCFSGIEFIEKTEQQVTPEKVDGPGCSCKKEQRRHTRIENSMVLKYHIFNNKGKAIGYGKGRTINLSQSGILLETQAPLEGSYVMLITMNVGTEVKLRGRIVHSTLQKNTGNYYSGIEFIGNKDAQVEAIVGFIKAYYRSKSGTYWIDLKK